MSRLRAALFIPLFLASLLAPGLALAIGGDFGYNATAQQAGLPSSLAGSSSIPGIIGNVIAVVLSALGIVFFVIILYAGFNWMTAMGNSEKVDKSKEILEGAVIGLVLVMAAYAITSFVFVSLAKNGAPAVSAR